MKNIVVAGALLAAALLASTWSAEHARADTATVKVDQQVNTQPAVAAADPCQGNTAEVCVSTYGGQTGDQAFLHVDLAGVPEGDTLAGVTVKLIPSSDTTGNANSANATLQACPLTQAIAANFSTSLPPSFDCKRGVSQGKLNADGSWTFDLGPMVTAWQAIGYTGVTLMPAPAAAPTPAPVPLPLPVAPPSAWSVSFTKATTSAQASYLPPVTPAEQAVITNLPGNIVASALPPPVAAPVATPAPAPVTRSPIIRTPAVTVARPAASWGWLILAAALGVLAAMVPMLRAAALGARGRQLSWPVLRSGLSLASSRTATAVASLALAASLAVGASGGTMLITQPGHTSGGGVVAGGSGARPGTGPGAASSGPVGSGGSSSTSSTTYIPGQLNPNLAPLKIGFTYDNSSQQIAAMLGVNIPQQGDPTVQIQAMVEYVNTHGGLAGHKVIPDVIQVNTDSTDTNQWNNACIQFTEDDHVFAVIGAAGNQITPMACYAQHHTPYLTGDVVLSDALEYHQWAPYVFLPSYAAEDQTMMAELQGLQAQGYFNGGKIGMVVQDFPEYHRIMDTQVGPRLASLGYAAFSNPESNPDVVYVVDSNGPGNADQVISEIQQAAVKFSVDGVDHVMLMYPGGGGWLFFWEAAEQQHYHPRYGYSSVDEPYAIQESNATQGGQNAGADQFKNSLGIGYLPGTDTSHEPFPDNSQEALCLKIMKAAGQSPSQRVNALGGEGYCAAMLLLQSAAGQVGSAPLTQDNEARAILGLGPYQLATDLPGGSGFSAGRPESATGYRLSHFDSGCSCFLYTSSTIYPFPT